jgi:hypothetical protein
LALRHWKLTPFPGVATVMANIEFAAVLSLNITPALAQGSVFPCEVTREIITA